MTLRSAALVSASLVAALALAPLASPKVPKANDYHSLLVSASNPKELLLGTHAGMFRSLDGCKTWKRAGLAGRDVMNLAQAGSTIWAAGHDVLAKSNDGGRSWKQVSPRGLPSLDVHGFSVLPGSPRTLFAEIAGKGQYTSSDGGGTFKLLSPPPAPMLMTLSAASTGDLFVGDMQNGIYVSRNGRSWTKIANGMAMGVAADPRDARHILATTTGIALSTDGGVSWKISLRSKVMYGPVAWSPHVKNTAYAVGYDRSLWRTIDGGLTWKRID